MAIYFKDKEITNIDSLILQTGLDITDIWFGNTNVYTVWQVYEGTLPTTLNANGDDMRQYQIYGAAGGVGDRTVQLFDYKEWFDSGFVDYGQFFDYGVVQLSPYTTYTLTTSFGEGISGVGVRETNFIVTVSGETPLTSVRGLSNVSPQTLTTNDDGKIFIYKRFKRNPTSAPSVVVVTESMFENGEWINIIEGTTVQTEYVPFGYAVDMATGSNILQSSEIEQGGWQAAAETIPQKIVNPKRCRSKNIYPISSKKIFYDFKSLIVNIAFIDSDGLSLGGSGFKSGVGSVDVPENAVKCLFIIANTDTGTNIIPAQVITAGIWASVDATTTPIYIGSDPLGKDEYIDYQAGKVYRMINGSLTPTDPPVPLPALPTCEGTTIVDYTGQSQAVPEKVLLKYRKEGY